MSITQADNTLVASGSVLVTGDLSANQSSHTLLSNGVVYDPAKILKYAEVFTIDYMNITDWTPVADGVGTDIGIVLRIGRSDVLISFTPDITVPDDTHAQNVFPSGNIFMTTENQVIWVKPYKPYNPTTVSGEIIYNMPGISSSTDVPVTTMGLPWRLG